MIFIVLHYKNNTKIIKITINLKINSFHSQHPFLQANFFTIQYKEMCQLFFFFFTLIWISPVFNPNKLFKETNFSDLSSDWFLFHSSTSFRSCSGPPWASTYTHTTKHVGRSRFKAGFEDLRSSRVALRT